MARASGSPLILVILVITSFRLQVQVLGKLEHTSDHAREHSGNLAWHLLELVSLLLIKLSLEGPSAV